jgi:glycosyltransferase involved in cell wall biosynthesis
MNVLILHQHFKTPDGGGALRSYFLAQAIVDRGDKVQVVTGSDYVDYHLKIYEGIEIHYLPIRYSNYFGYWKRIFSFLRFIISICAHSKKFSKANICYAISVPLTIGLAARWIKWRYKIPYIFEVGDLWPDAPIELEVIQNSLLKKWLWRMERNIYQQANSVVALSPSIKEAIGKKVIGKNIHVIPNMADTEFFKPELKNPLLEERLQVKNKFVIAYLGAMGFANGLEYILNCAKVCHENKLPVQFLLAGDGVEKENLKRKSIDLKLHNLSFIEFLNREGIKELMNVADAVFVCYRHSPILETGSPNKFFDGLAAGKLIIINFGGWIRKEIEEANCGFYVDPENPESILHPFNKIIKTSQLSEFQKRSRQLAEEKFSRKVLTEKWISDVIKP